jgi:hypothetical protein
LLSLYLFFTFALPLSGYYSLSLIGLPRSPRITHDLNTKKKKKNPKNQNTKRSKSRRFL